jgi:hypothetical protein
MISFIKTLFGFGSKEITPSVAPYKIEPATTITYVEPVNPVFKSAVAANSTASAKKNRRPRNRNKAKASSAAPLQKAPAAKVAASSTPAKVAKVKSTKPAPAKSSK